MKIKKYNNIKRLDYRVLKFGDLIFIGMRGHSNPGKVRSKSFRKYKKILEKLFNRYKKENKERKVIFISHNIAYNTKLDRISKKALKEALKLLKKRKTKNGRHYGSKMARRIIDQWQPVLSIGGHIHESYGKDKIGRTIMINPGSAHDGRAAIINLDEQKGKVNNIKFVR
ncbi:MAG TPA: hypothetical protein VMC07_02770, partial [Candidatus Omnitrophota bacterium]|nr:hypothetical protein [Candidatus Omnitrophota bacterium]